MQARMMREAWCAKRQATARNDAPWAALGGSVALPSNWRDVIVQASSFGSNGAPEVLAQAELKDLMSGRRLARVNVVDPGPRLRAGEDKRTTVPYSPVT
jgi:hypothetical protein